MLDDYLRLLDRSLAGFDALVFTGVSGSGKSSYLRLLVERHPDFDSTPVSRIGPAPIDWHRVEPREELVLVDEIHGPFELLRVARLLHAGHRLLVASHVPEWVGRIILAPWRVDFFRTDQDAAKLGRHLSRSGITHTPAALRDFVAVYGANYTDLEIVLERVGGDDFDRALRDFRKSTTIQRARSDRVGR